MSIHPYIKQIHKQKGFTLIEMIVSVGLFGVVAAISIGAFVSLFAANSKAQSITSIMNNLNLSIENMTRIIRFADVYHCEVGGTLTDPNSCPNGDTFIAVTTSGAITIFRFNETNHKIEVSYNGGATYAPITSSDTTITYAKFFVLNTTPGDENQPYVLMVIRGFAGSKASIESNFDIQTVVSERPLDLLRDH